MVHEESLSIASASRGEGEALGRRAESTDDQSTPTITLKIFEMFLLAQR